MLKFYSASTRVINTKRAVRECLEIAVDNEFEKANLIIYNASIGHDFREILDHTRELAPQATVVVGSACGIVGREGVSETLKDIGVMVVEGTDFVVAHCDEINGFNARQKCAALAQTMLGQSSKVNMVYFLASGIDIDNDGCIAGFEQVLGEDVTIFGATTSDNMKGIINWQGINDKLMNHGAVAIGFCDESLKVATQASHGFRPYGGPMVVTRSEGNIIKELNGKPAWSEYISKLQLADNVTCGDTIPIGALAESLSPDDAEDYGNTHILRVVTRHEGDDMYYATAIDPGKHLWLTIRDEELIFSDMDRMTTMLKRSLGGAKIEAVFHADCLARGKFLFNRVMKEELVGKMQYPFYQNGQCPSWLGMYGFGEFARLNGKNTFHNYTTALYILYR